MIDINDSVWECYDCCVRVVRRCDMEAAELPYSSNWVCMCVCIVHVLYTVPYGRTDAALPTGSTRTWIT